MSTVKPLSLVLDLYRKDEGADPHAFQQRPQTYYRRDAEGTQGDAKLDWNTELMADLSALHGLHPGSAIARLGHRLTDFLQHSRWGKHEVALRAAIEAKRPIELTITALAAELYAIPWELAPVGAGEQRLGEVPGCLIRYAWPGTDTKLLRREPGAEGGRVLFAWSAAAGAVPVEQHKKAILAACRDGHLALDPPLPALDELKHVSYDTLTERLKKAEDDGSPYAVLHLLCHGGRLPGNADLFGLVWRNEESEERQVIDGLMLGKLLRPHAATLRLVVLCACMGGDAGTPGNHLGGVAQGIHRAGVEAVVASRFPFSVPGSIAFAKTFYRRLLVDLDSVESAFLESRGELAREPSCRDDLSLQLYARARDGGNTRPIVFAPYRGLLAFEKRHKRFFFGRTGEVDELIRELGALVTAGKPRFMVVAGDSGTGKSSMVLASAVPRLEEEGWLSQILRPGSAPLAALDQALAVLDKALADKALAAKSPRRGLLVVDQLEELFTSVESAAERTAFACRLWELAREPGGPGVIATLRIDFLGRCGEILLDEKSGKRLDKVACDPSHQVLVAQMDVDQLREAVEEPAGKVGLVLDAGLTGRILGDVNQEPGALPLVQYALRLLWEKREGRTLTQASYDDMNGVMGALNQHAGQVIDDLVNGQVIDGLVKREENERIARRLLVRLVHIGRGDAPNTRKRTRLAELRPGDAADAKRFDAVLRELVDQRLLVCSGKEDEQTVEVAHEALIRKWKRLVKWIQEERGNLLAKEELERWVETFEKTKALLSQGQLEMAEQLRKADAELVTGKALALVESSRAEIDRITEAARRARDTLRVTLAREHLEKDPLVSAVLLREVEAEDPATVPTWLEHAIDVLRLPAMVTAVLEGHDGGVNSAAWSPDGTRIVTASADKTARMWDAATGEALPWSGGHAAEVETVAWSGAHIATTTKDGMVRVCEVSTGAITERRFDVWSLCAGATFFQDGARIVIAQSNGPTQVCDVATGAVIATMKHESYATHAAWSPDGTCLVIAIKDGSVQLWNAATGEAIRTLRGPAEPGRFEEVCAAAWSPDGIRIVTGSTNRTAQVWNAATGEALARLKGHGNVVCAAAWSPDGTRLVTASWDGTARVWDPTTGKELAVLRGHTATVTSVAWSPDGARIVTTTYQEARVWNVVTGNAVERARLSLAATGEVLAALDGHGGAILSAAVGAAPGSDPIRTWVALTGEVLVALEGHTSLVTSAAWSPDGEQIVTASSDKTARVWDAAGGNCLHTLEGHEAEVKSAAWSPVDGRIVTASMDETARVWPVVKGELPAILHCGGSVLRKPGQLPVHMQGYVTSAVWSPVDGRIVTTSTDFTAKVWDTQTNTKLLPLDGHEASVGSAAWSPDSTKIVTASDDKTARVWDAATGAPIFSFKEHKAAVTSAAWSPVDGRIATASDDKTVRVWDAATGAQLFTLEGHMDSVTSVAWSPDGAHLVTASADESARVWDAATGEARFTLGYQARGTKWFPSRPSAAWSPKGAKHTKIVTTSNDARALIWNLDVHLLRDRLWRATAFCLPARRRMRLLNEDEITATANAAHAREEEARQRAARPILQVRAVIPPLEEQRRRSEAAIADHASRAVSTAAHETPPTEPKAKPEPAAPESPPSPPALPEPAAAAGAPGEGTAQMEMVLSELRTLFRGAEQKVGELLARLPGRPPEGG